MCPFVRQGSPVHVTLFRAIAVLAAAALSTVGAVPAQAATIGYVRLAHLSPDTPNVDVYLSSQTGAIKEQEIKGVGYGVMSQYLRLPVGGYTVAMRKSGAPKTDPPVLTTQVSVTDGSAQTVAGVGRYSELGLKVLKDDLTLPTGNKSKVRIIQASVQVPLLGVLANGSTVADNVAFATTTDYQLVNPGSLQLQIRPADGRPATNIAANLGNGNVYSLLILDSGNNTLKTELRKDATRQGGLPDGGVDTGGGGMAGASDTNRVWLIGAGMVLALIVAGSFLVIRRRRSTVL